MDEPRAESLRQVLEAVGRGDRQAAAELLPLVYEELRRLAKSRISKLPPGNTLQGTALVHEAYMKLVGKKDPGWESRGHFFGAAAQAMRQILVDQAKRKKSVKHGGGKNRIDIEAVDIPLASPADDILVLDAALDRLRDYDPRKAQIVTLRFFGGLTREETAGVLGVSLSTLDREWRYIVAHLQQELHGEDLDT